MTAITPMGKELYSKYLGISTLYYEGLCTKKMLAETLSRTYRDFFPEIGSIEVKAYLKKDTSPLETKDIKPNIEEFVLLTWKNGGSSTASNNANSISATARNIARMIDGGVYENWSMYYDIMASDEWQEII